MAEAARSRKDILAGAIFVVFGLAFAIGALDYDVGSPLRMGAGFYPLVLGALLVGFGLLVVAKAFVAGEHDPIGGFELRAVVLITAALLFFGLTVRGLGVVAALFGATLLASFARSRTGPREALLIAAGLTILSVLIFVVALRLRLPLVGSWLPL